MKFFKVTALPGTPEASAFYYVLNGNLVDAYITSKTGTYHQVAGVGGEGGGGGVAGVTTFNTRSGAVTLTLADITTALGFTPEPEGNYLTGIDSGMVTNALGFTPQVAGNYATGGGTATGTNTGDQDLSPYATISAVNTALASYATDAEVATLLTSYTTTVDLNTALALKQDVSPTINTITGTTHTVTAADNGEVLLFTNAGAVTVTMDTALPVKFNCMLVQGGAGAVTVSTTGITLRNRQSHTKTAGQYASMSVLVIANPGSAPEVLLQGDTAA